VTDTEQTSAVGAAPLPGRVGFSAGSTTCRRWQRGVDLFPPELVRLKREQARAGVGAAETQYETDEKVDMPRSERTTV
jgi:hypothetical protein